MMISNDAIPHSGKKERAELELEMNYCSALVLEKASNS